jgi:hypothetical protein
MPGEFRAESSFLRILDAADLAQPGFRRADEFRKRADFLQQQFAAGRDKRSGH